MPLDDGKTAVSAIEGMKDSLNYKEVTIDESIAKVSVVGAGMESHPGVASKMFEALYDAGINIRQISTSEIRVTVLIDEKYTDYINHAVTEMMETGRSVEVEYLWRHPEKGEVWVRCIGVAYQHENGIWKLKGCHCMTNDIIREKYVDKL